MRVGAPLLQRWLKRKLKPRDVSWVIVFLVFLSTLGLQRMGWLQFLEFHAYDFFVRHRDKAPDGEPIVLVELTESDIHSPTLDYPVPNDKMAELLRDLEADQPAVIGLDIWEDIPVPKSGIHLAEFNQVLLSNTNIAVIFTLEDKGGNGGIAPPAILKSSPERIAFNDNFHPDLEVDLTVPKVRRVLLFTNTPSVGTAISFPFRLATFYLGRKGIETEPNPDDPLGFSLGKARLRPFKANDGAYVGAADGGFQMLLDFKGPERFTRYSFSEVLSGQIRPGAFRDKIVMVGINTPSVSDERVTPLHHDHRGIDVQAQAVHQLLRFALKGERPLRFWDDWMEDAWMLFLCAAGGAMGYLVHSPWRSAGTIVFSLVGLGGLVWLAFIAGWWIPLVAPAVAYMAAAGLVTSYVSYQEKKQRGQLMQLFSKQVSPDIAQALWEQRDEFLAGKRPRSQKLTATVLFTDMEGFSTTSEKLDAEFLMDWLNEYMDTMATAIMAHQGVVEKYIGDAIMAVFGVPLARTTQDEIRRDACNAVRCALAMGAKMDGLNAGWKSRDLPVSGMRIGIHTGPLIAGSLGSAERQEYTVIGDSVNTASRLESFDKAWVDAEAPPGGCRILISEATFQLLSPGFVTKRVGTMNLKNKNEPVTIYLVTGEIA